MAQEFENLGGSSSSNPSFFRRWASSLVIRRLSNTDRRDRRRQQFEKQRKKTGEAHRIEYFHQVEDPYSYLAAQVLQALLNTYDIELRCHLVTGPPGDNAPEPDMLLPYSQRDCEVVAPHYGLVFPLGAKAPGQKQIDLAARILAAAPESDFPQLSVTVSKALWSGDILELKALAAQLGECSPEESEARLLAGNARRQELGHYSAAMFWYGEEWYWGIDRLYHLENRLAELSLRRGAGRQLLMPRPGIEKSTLHDSRTMTLEVYMSLRSPYSAIIFDKVVSLAEHTKVHLVVRPVLPMVMRGTPVTMQKGMYIAFDAAREAESLGVPWGNAYDPIGKPVNRGFSLYEWAEPQGKGSKLLSAFMELAWSQKVNTNTRRGLRKVVNAAGLDWREARTQLKNTKWEEVVETNRLSMYRQGIWGVPAFRLLDQDANVIVSAWGQDRLWLIARIIQERLRDINPAN
jgi:2-hydroxychromene-2-carboxylate isomerase